MYVFNSFKVFNKTGLQPVSRPVVQILGVFPKDLKKVLKTVQKYIFYSFLTLMGAL